MDSAREDRGGWWWPTLPRQQYSTLRAGYDADEVPPETSGRPSTLRNSTCGSRAVAEAAGAVGAVREAADVADVESPRGNGPDSSPGAGQDPLVVIQAPPRYRRRSVHPECQATAGPRDDPDFMARVQPCGSLSAICTDIPIVEANRDYPGGGIGAVVPGQDYLVQFDVGLHPEVAREILRRRLREIDSCVHCPGLEAFGERCLETVVTGGAMWGDLGRPSMGLAPGAYDCMGGCGRGCAGALASHTSDDVGALDCLKHDLCSAWKSIHSGRPTQGFCHDPDCGDEGAMAIFNCWKGWRLFGSIGGARSGPFSEPAICDQDDGQVKGCWNHGGWFTPGRCKLFQGWDRGQGIPDPNPLRSPVQML